MRSRQGITELFSTFLQLDTDRVIGWAVDGRLRRNILHCQARLPQPEESENFWVSYWCKIWQEQPESLAKGHLSAYLQEVCYWAAQKTIVKVSSTQYSVSDCFQMAITRIDKVLKGFKPNIGFSLKSYSSVIFSTELKELLCQQQEIDICTNWRLLRKVTQKRLVESLQNVGLNADTIQSYVLAWKAYQALYAPQKASGTRQLPKPDAATWQAIAEFYNSERHTQLSVPGVNCTVETIEKWLVGCAKAVRSYFYPDFVSINAPRGDDSSAEYQDILPQLQQESLITEFIAEEELLDRQSQHSQISTVLAAALNDLDQESQIIIQSYYNERLTQQQIAQKLQIKQYTVSRRLTKAKDSLLLKLANWSKESLHIQLNPSVLNYMSTFIEEWLQAFYSPSSS
ncbi:sigma-70 family RNA polymerase sigma factor [Aetokthonos hydrillicola Thurmond2011]|jgi:RNA polymerase sigma factor (sigma-70 family)|uniref:Sigma-70 family RNA polymerase sigma factor n=1 Tax=Aetokthonos hydrillicola Thurmond2011 TaxID=2712845 RepID=A0AAP5IA85_9CYAN|nr:sigma-70 family RNA polymerase sigma factor [Aetokthonos hydrillicola]MBO3458231.1 sigma-70 family RNA polymerase sigma factor [Aetokthonos hydrillicola CCALA 1050]MBW4584450.1 sigma-70 family RNA polymerase sigma factor [Aetokthonos hydrillicola CCALA 1050]MDR9896412.1 sigma-70 family RNA polymerase sigma factor [Aetokthonos hydrillicola Thurmond2011]